MKRARVHVMPKAGVLDPQGEAVRRALEHAGFEGVAGVRQGKAIDLDIADSVTSEDLERMCERLLANTVIESYSVRIEGEPGPGDGASNA